MELCIFTEPQEGATYDELLSVARLAEQAGFTGFFRSDHFLRIRPGDPGPGPTDAWVTLAGLARETTRIRLGVLVSSATFRLPGPLAVAVAQVDQMSGGRVEFGLGTGWYEAEHTAQGIPFPPLRERFERFEEQLQIVKGIWATAPGETFSFAGRHYQLENNSGLPKPRQQPHPPIIIGGKGPRRTPRLAARYAAEFNTFAAFPLVLERFDTVRSACVEIGRDPTSIKFSSSKTVCVGTNSADLERRAAAIGRDLDTLREVGLAGHPEELVEQIRRYREAGSTRIYFQLFDHRDLAQVELLGAEVLPHVKDL